MTTVNNCNIPDDLLYQVEKHVWVKRDADGTARIGMTDPAQKLAGKIIVVTPKKVGRTITRGQSAGTVESSKWVGPVPSPLSGEIVAVNQVPLDKPTALNADPYGNWIVKLAPTNWDEEAKDLVTGEQGVEAYRGAAAGGGHRLRDLMRWRSPNRSTRVAGFHRTSPTTWSATCGPASRRMGL